MDINESNEIEQNFLWLPSLGKLPELPGIDVKGALDRLRVSIEIYKISLKFFVKSYTDFTGKVKDALKKNDTDNARKLLHTLRGSAVNLGANDIEEAARKLGSAIKDEKKDLESLVDNLENALNTVLNSIEVFMTERNDGQ